MVVTYDYLAKHGRLGNQMFQYALLVGLKYKLGCEIIIDPELRTISPLFEFFNLQECRVEPIQIDNLYKERMYHFDPDVFNITEDTNFRGYFQSEKYFEHCKDVIKREFTFRQTTLEHIDKVLENYQGKRLVGVHVRRGDYLVLSDLHPTCSVEYYSAAMDLLDGENVLFLCVSDDLQWCRENLIRDNIIFISQHPVQDLCLLSKCDDYIISNSTFSWWGSWLGVSENKKVTAPKTWYGGRYLEWDLKNLYREEFIKL